MKIHIILLLMCFGVKLSAQYYTSGVEPISLREYNVDLTKSKADSLYAAGDYQLAADTYKTLSDNWNSILNDPSASESQIQNYFFAETMFHKTRFRLGHREDSYRDLKNLENLIIQKLGADHQFFGMYYHELGLMTFQHKGDAQKSFDQTFKATSIREALLPEYKKDLGWSYNNLAVIIKRIHGVDSAQHYQFKALEKRKEIVPADPAMILVSYSNISQNYLRLGDYRLEKEYLLKAKEVGKELPTDHPYNLMVITNLAKVYHRNGEFRKALGLSKYALAQRKKSVTGEGHVTLRDNYQAIVNNYMTLGYRDSSAMYLDTIITILNKYQQNYAITLAYTSLARTKENNDEAIKIFKEAITYCNVDPECNDIWIADIYHDICKIYLRKNDPYQALIFALKAKELFDNNPNGNNPDHVKLYKTLADISIQLGKTDEALNYLESSVKLHANDTEISSYWILETQQKLASLYSSTGKLDKADKVFERLFSSINKNANISQGVFRDAYTNLSMHYQNKGDVKNSIDAAQKAKTYTSSNPSENTINAKTRIRLFNTYRKANREKEAKSEFEEACRLLGIHSWLDQKFSRPQIPSFQLVGSIKQIIELYKHSGNYLYQNLNAQLELIRVITSLLDDCRNNYFFYDSEQYLLEIESEFYDLVLAQLYDQHRIEPDSKILEVVLLIMEKSRSIGMGRISKGKQLLAASESGLNIISEENRINFQSEKAFQEYNNIVFGSNDSLLLTLTARLDRLNGEKDSLLQTLEQEYPKYYKDRYLHKVVDLDNAIRMCVNQNIGLLNYYASKDKIYVFFITETKVYFNQIHLPEINNQIRDLKSILSNPNNTSSETDYLITKAKFIDLSAEVFEALIGSNLFEDSPEELLIIPDGELVNLPFEVLLKGEVENNLSYKALPYLIRDKVISYHGSLTQYQNTETSSDQLTYEGYAPSYVIKKSKRIKDDNSPTLFPLIRNAEEVERSSGLFSGQKYIGKEANLETFKHNVGGADILHLAMHTSVNDKVPSDSYLSFASYGEEDKSSLYAHEIIEMNINADLVILSACETNSVAQQDNSGEGIKGLARSFFIALCPNLIMSNWLVDDQSSNKIIYNFLLGIKGGVNPAQALRSSKLDFINSSSNIHSHPTYWAPFIYYGGPMLSSSDPIKNFNFGLLLFALVIALSVIVFFSKSLK